MIHACLLRNRFRYVFYEKQPLSCSATPMTFSTKIIQPDDAAQPFPGNDPLETTRSNSCQSDIVRLWNDAGD
jgi:hypothetical protein